MAKKLVDHNDVSDEGLARDNETLNSNAALAAEQLTRKLEAMEKRLAEREKALDMNAAELQKRQDEQQATMADRMRMLESSVQLHGTGRLPMRRGSGKIIQVQKGDFICYNTLLGAGTSIQGGWVKCSQDQAVSPTTTQVGIARGPFQYDEEYGAPYHHVVMNRKVCVQPYRVYYKDPNRDQVVGPPYLIEQPIIHTQPQIGIAQAG
jgi:hypothetical protein